jgi:phosphoglycerol geranylgeranyltransferase
MKVKEYLREKLERGERLLFVVIDPEDHPSMEHIEKTAKLAEENKGDAIVVGGSTGVQGDLLEEAVKRIKENVSLPVILFPGNVGTITRKADAIYFMSLLNSRNVYWITRAQLVAAPVIYRERLEALPTAYLVFEPGGTVGYIGEADLIPRNKPKIRSE